MPLKSSMTTHYSASYPHEDHYVTSFLVKILILAKARVMLW
jgi:hypothetical protein